MNRKQRRALQKRTGGAATQLQQAVSALQEVGGLDRMKAMMEEVHRQSQETHQLVSGLVDDYQDLADQVEAERDVFLDALVSLAPEETQEQLRGQLLGAIDQRLKEIREAREQAETSG